MITGIRVKNLRSIVDSGLIRLRKINVLVGRNSAGKSSLLRVLPLLRQSMEQATKGPILWYGRLVDFGTFQNAVRRGALDRTITFEFESLVHIDRPILRRAPPQQTAKSRQRKPLLVNTSAVLGLSAADSYGKVRRIVLQLEDDRVQVEFGDDASIRFVELNGSAVELRSDQRWWVSQGTILPQLHLMKVETFLDDQGQPEVHETFEDEPFLQELADSLIGLYGAGYSASQLKAISRMLTYGPADEFLAVLSEIGELRPIGARHLEEGSAEHSDVSEVRRLALLVALPKILTLIDRDIAAFASSVRYLEPLRATAERYYRLQDLAVGEIDSRGANVAMFLNSLSWYEQQRLREWMKKTLGFFVQVSQKSGHVEVEIVSEGGAASNLADLGFGYSQLLPIILQLWRAIVSPVGFNIGRAVDSGAVIAVEQPELHLHPQYQALLADTLAAVFSAEQGSQGSFFAETHSEHFINRLGELISEGRLSAEDVQVIVIEQEVGGDTSVTSAEFTDAGFLGDGWPVGFFVPRRRDAPLA